MAADDSKLDFIARVGSIDEGALHAERPRSVMLNVGLRCDSACTHCHHRCGPERDEQMSAETAEMALDLACALDAELVDVTGGSPELWPHLTALVEAAGERGLRMRVRTGLGALASRDNDALARFLAKHGVELLASFPGASAEEIAVQRGPGAYREGLSALIELRHLGYGTRGGPPLLIAFNPEIGELGAPQAATERRVRAGLGLVGVSFERLLSITNVPVGRALDDLEARGEAIAYVHRLADSFNPATLSELACRHGIEVAWDGRLADCDFNLAAGLGTAAGPQTVAEALERPEALTGRRIAFARHCFACTAAAGSS